MTPTTSSALALGFACAIAWQTAPPPQSTAERFRASGALQLVDEFVASRMRQERTPGVALAITSRDGTMMSSTYGFADIRARVPLTPDHLFEIGSISKSFTAIALLQQREAGRFDPAAPILTYLSWLAPQAPTSITGHHLLTHTAGIPRDRDDVPSSLFQAMALRDAPPGVPPGQRYAYSNVGYQVLGYALAAIAGRQYPDVVRDGIMRPLGMGASDPQFTHDTRLRLAVGYEDLYDDRPPHVTHPLAPATWLEYAAGDGSVVSNGPDMAAYVRMLLNKGRGPTGPLLSPESFDLLTAKHVRTGDGRWYGYGMAVREVEGRTVLAHSGGMVGYSAMLVADLTDGVGAVAMINGPGSADAIAEFAVIAGRAALKGASLPTLPPPDDPSRVANAADYAGVYTPASGAPLRIVAEGERLWLVHKGERVVLERRGTDRFYVNHPDYALFLLQFARDTEKQVAEASWGEAWYAAERYKGQRTFTSPDAWRAFTGHYRTPHAWFNNFRVLLRKGQLRLVSPAGGEQVLVPLGTDEFALGDKDSAERIRFDTIVDGGALRATLAGVPYYRSFTP